MKKHRPVKHAHRRAMIAQKKAKGKYSKVHLPFGGLYGPSCSGYGIQCPCWGHKKYCFYDPPRR